MSKQKTTSTYALLVALALPACAGHATKVQPSGTGTDKCSNINRLAIPNSTCDFLWTPIDGGCNYYGYWETGVADGPLKQEKCLSIPGCTVESGFESPGTGPDIQFCVGTPECGDLKDPRFCRVNEVCTCNEGYKKYAGECRPLLCEGAYVADELWVTEEVLHGVKAKHCLPSGIVAEYIMCDPGLQWDGFGCYKYIP